MTLRRDRLPRGLTPRLLSRDAAAAYCGLSADTFEAVILVQPISLSARRRLWDIRALDRWLDQQSGIAEPYIPAAEWLGKLDDRKNGRR
jgi:hypothetical protein